MNERNILTGEGSGQGAVKPSGVRPSFTHQNRGKWKCCSQGNPGLDRKQSNMAKESPLRRILRRKWSNWVRYKYEIVFRGAQQKLQSGRVSGGIIY